MSKETIPLKQALKPNEGKEVARPLRPDQLPIAQHAENFKERHQKEPEIASIERRINALVSNDYVEMMRAPDSKIAAIFFATRTAHREHGFGLEPADFVGPKHRETQWGKLMLTRIGIDLEDKNMKVTIRPLLASNSGSNEALQAGMRASALYLKGVYGWKEIPEYTVQGKGVSEDDIAGHDPRIKEARRKELEAGRPPKQIEKK